MLRKRYRCPNPVPRLLADLAKNEEPASDRDDSISAPGDEVAVVAEPTGDVVDESPDEPEIKEADSG